MVYGSILLMVLLGAPIVGALGARRSGRASVDRRFAAAAVVSAALLVGVVHVDGPVSRLGGALRVDRAGAAWALFVLVTGLVVRTFARRQLAADPARERFHLRSAAALTAAVGLCVAGDLWMVVLASVATSLAAAGLVGTLGSSQPVAARVRTTLLAGDVLLAFAVVLTVAATGSTDRAALAELDGASRDLVALAVVLAAVVKCAQPPVHRWLPRTLAAPTPVSALLHAGIVNAGGVLLVRFAPVVHRSLVATIVGLVLAGTGVVLGAAVLRARADVKGELVWSTVAQMGFMLVQVLVGLAPAAAAHLIAHGAYKSSCFLGSGSAVEHRPVRPPRARPAHHVAAVGLSALVVLGSVLLTGFDVAKHGGAQVLVPVFAGFTVLSVLAGPAGLRRGVTRGVVQLVLVVAAGTAAYLWGIGRFESWLQLPDHTPDASLAMALGFTAAVVVAATVVALTERRPLRPAALALRARSVAASRRPALDTVITGGS